MLAGQPGSRDGLLSERLSPCPCLLRREDHLTLISPVFPRNPRQDKPRGMAHFEDGVTHTLESCCTLDNDFKIVCSAILNYSYTYNTRC